MTKVTLNGLDIITGTQRSSCVAMLKIVKSCIRPANSGDDFFEMSNHGLKNQISTQLVCENQIHWIGPSVPACFFI